MTSPWFSHPRVPGYFEVAGDNQYWWVPVLDHVLPDEDVDPYGETAEELRASLRKRERDWRGGRGAPGG
jgi:hypothetical protein